jgi:hypothetical protein
MNLQNELKSTRYYILEISATSSNTSTFCYLKNIFQLNNYVKVFLKFLVKVLI